MDFSLTDDQKALVQAAADFSKAELADHAAEWDETSHFPVDVIRRAGRRGFSVSIRRKSRAGWACRVWMPR